LFGLKIEKNGVAVNLGCMTKSSAIAQLLATPESPELGPGPRTGVQSQPVLNSKLAEIFKNSELPRKHRELIRALILLWHDHIEAAHGIAQEIDNADGAFIHGIVHRREPDYGNAKYWFRRAGHHGAYAEIAARARRLLDASLMKRLLPNGNWDALAFVDCCEETSGRTNSDSVVKILREVQGLETEALLSRFCQ